MALQLCTTAELNEDQMRAVALVAKPLQETWDKSRLAREHATTINPSADSNKLPLVGALVRLLIVGGGGCGKTRIFNKVLIPLLTAFYGTEGVLKQASTNKAARLLQGCGKTIHVTNKLTVTSSLRAVNLRLNEKKQQLLGNIYGKAGAKLIDEFSPINAKLLHADAFITTLARAPLYKLQPECYAQCDQTWGALPVLVLGGDELQLPPVPMEASLLAPVEGTSDEHKAGVRLFGSLRQVYRLSTAMRFDDDE